MDYFVSDDIITAILSHLPVKILFKFRSVSKSWRDIIDSSSFRNIHVQNQVSKEKEKDDDDDTLLFLQLTMPRPDPDSEKVFKALILDDFPSYNDFLSNNEIDHDHVLFSDVVRGLICLYKKCSSNPIALCNPILKEIKILPDSDPFPCSSREVGLGYDSVEQDFKVVQISTRGESIVVEVYSRKQNKWRKLDHHPLLHHKAIMILEAVPSSSSGGAFAHWYATDKSATSTESSKQLVASFDMRSEALRTIGIPPFQDAKKQVIVLAKEDSLIAFVWREDGRLIMWENKLQLDNNEEDWIKTGSVGPFNAERVWPLMWWKSGRGLVCLCAGYTSSNSNSNSSINGNGCVVFYDCCTRQIVRCVDRHYSLFRIVQYNSPTFISP